MLLTLVRSYNILTTIQNLTKILFAYDCSIVDMINMIKLSFAPNRVEWIHSPGDAINALAV